MRFFLRSLLLASLLLPALAPAAPAAPLRVVMDQNYPPFVLRNADGELEGYTVDLWRLWQQKTGVPVQMIPANWGDVQPMQERGGADVIDPIFQPADRAARMDFSKSYATVATAVYADASIGGIHALTSLRGFEVAVRADDACAEQLRRADVGKVRIFPTYESLVAAAASQTCWPLSVATTSRAIIFRRRWRATPSKGRWCIEGASNPRSCVGPGAKEAIWLFLNCVEAIGGFAHESARFPAAARFPEPAGASRGRPERPGSRGHDRARRRPAARCRLPAGATRLAATAGPQQCPG
jgi:hypothetical protein